MAVEASRAPMDVPSRKWEGREHMIESLAKLEGKPADHFFLARTPASNEPAKRGVYADMESPTSVVNSLMSPYGIQDSASPAAERGREAEQMVNESLQNVSVVMSESSAIPRDAASPGDAPAEEDSSMGMKKEALRIESFAPELGGQQTAMESIHPNEMPYGAGDSANESKKSGAQKTPSKNGVSDFANRSTSGSGDGATGIQESAGGDENNGGGGRKSREGVSDLPDTTLARERELAFEGNQQPRKDPPRNKQDFFTKIKIAMCAGPQTTESNMETNKQINIGWPTNVKHLVHVSFDRFRGFVGLPEDMGEEQKNAPGASLSVFGVNPESLQVTWDRNHKHCVPTVLCQLHDRLLAKNGLRTEGVFRIAAESAEEEYIRSMLNKGEEPPNTEVHVLAGLIKAWFRELPTGVLDTLTPEQVAAAQKESEVVALVKQLPDIHRALLDWAVDLMADVVEQQSYNKMNARNIAMVFAPNMTQVMDPLKALMHAVKVMNLLKVLIEKRLRERRQAAAEEAARVEREMLRLAEEEEARVRAEEEAAERALKEREEREAATQREAAHAAEGGVHTDPANGDEEMEIRSSALVDGTASWQQLAASVAAILAGGGAGAADRAAVGARLEGSDSGEEFFESNETIKAPAEAHTGAVEVSAPEAASEGGPAHGSVLDRALSEADAPSLQTEGYEAKGGDVAGDVATEEEACPEQKEAPKKEGFSEKEGLSKEALSGEERLTEDGGVSEAMSLPVTRSELLVLVTELEKKDELVPVVEEDDDSREPPAVVREKVDIALERDDVHEIGEPVHSNPEDVSKSTT